MLMEKKKKKKKKKGKRAHHSRVKALKDPFICNKSRILIFLLATSHAKALNFDRDLDF